MKSQDWLGNCFTAVFTGAILFVLALFMQIPLYLKVLLIVLGMLVFTLLANSSQPEE